MTTIEIKMQLHEIKTLVEQSALNAKEVWTSSDLIKYTGMSYSKLTKLTSSGTIPFYKPTNGSLYFKKSEIINWITNHKVHSDQEADLFLKNHMKNKKA